MPGARSATSDRRVGPWTLAEPLGRGAPAALGADETRIVSIAPGRIEVAHRSQRAGYLLLLESWFPGWQARVGDEVAPTIQANVSFQALPIAAGEHSVTFEYVPTYRAAALGFTGLAALALAASALLWRRLGAEGRA